MKTPLELYPNSPGNQQGLAGFTAYRSHRVPDCLARRTQRCLLRLMLRGTTDGPFEDCVIVGLLELVSACATVGVIVMSPTVSTAAPKIPNVRFMSSPLPRREMTLVGCVPTAAILKRLMLL